MTYELVTIGASAGGIPAVKSVLSGLPADFPWPILYAQHMGAEQDSKYIAQLVGAATKLNVREAQEDDELKPGTVYLAPANRHLLVKENKRIELSLAGKVKCSRPSIDVTFNSAAERFGDKVIGIIMTGANDDGASGLAQVKMHGGYAVAQEPFTATVDCMPRSAISECAVDQILTPYGIGMLLRRLTQNYKKGVPNG